MINLPLALGTSMIALQIAFPGLAAAEDDESTIAVSDIQEVYSQSLQQERTGTRTVHKQVTEPREETYSVRIPRVEYYYQQRGRKCILCRRTVWITETRTRTVNVCRTVTEQVPYTYNVQGSAPAFTSPKWKKTKVTVILDPPLPLAVGPTFDNMKSGLSELRTSIDKLSFSNVTREPDVVTTPDREEGLRAVSKFQKQPASGMQYQAVVEVNGPTREKLVIQVYAARINPTADPKNLTEAAFLLPDKGVEDFGLEVAESFGALLKTPK